MEPYELLMEHKRGIESEDRTNNKKRLKMDSKQRRERRDTEEVKELDETKHKCIPVLADEYTVMPKLVNAYACDIKNPKQTSNIIRIVQQLYPLPKLPFLKRVKSNGKGFSLQVLLCLLDEDSDIFTLQKRVPVRSILKEHFSDALGLSEEAEIVQVPSQPPLTRSQYEYCLQYWAVQFHENKKISKALSGSLFSESDSVFHESMMSKAIAIAKRSYFHGNETVGAVVVDPSLQKVIAVGYDNRVKHPIQHAVMCALDDMAHQQGGGSWINQEAVKDSTVIQGESHWKKESNTTSEKPYLCTGFDLYVTREPCVMCAMALVHSRIRRTFYGCQMEEGALGSLYKIHTQIGLNHHFEVYSGVLEEECLSLNKDLES